MVDLVQSWIKSVPVEFIDSQVAGRRLQQWLLAYHYFVPGRDCDAVTPEFLQSLLVSMESQAEFLCQNLTPEGNHRTIELAAIFSFATLFPELPKAGDLQTFAQAELVENLRQDFLADGVQKELSTDYHHTVLKNFLRVRELAVLNGIEFSPEYDRLLKKTLKFSIYAHKPDGYLPAINDGDINSYLSLLNKARQFFHDDEILFVASQGQSGRQPASRSMWFEDSGYCILRSDWAEKPYEDGRYLFFDAGPLGFGSHGHYDLLSFEAAAYGRSLIVDPGRYTYRDISSDGVNWRHMFKGTAAHNTVVIDGMDQLSYRGEKPTGPEPEAKVLDFVSLAGFDSVRGSAISPEYPVEHLRSICFVGDEYWLITDQLNGKEKHHYQQFFHLAPEALTNIKTFNEPNGCGLLSENIVIIQPATPGIGISMQTGFFSPEYGFKQLAPVLSYSQECTGVAWFHTLIYPYKTTPPILAITTIPALLEESREQLDEAKVLRIDIKQSSSNLCDYFLFNAAPENKTLVFDDLVCRAQVLVVRRNPDGDVLSLHAKGLAFLKIGNSVLLDQQDQGIDLSFFRGRLELTFKSLNLHEQSFDLSQLNQVVGQFIRQCEGLS